MYRVTCEGCERPMAVCICAHLITLKPRTKVVVLQHPREEDNAIGTAWMVERCLSAERIVGVELEGDPRYRRAIASSAILLAPGPSAIDLHEHPPAGPVTLVVIDGTWSQARKVVRLNPSLATLPRYAFRPAQPSNYRIRKEPADHCVSTIEATVAALDALEPETEAGRVLAAFDAMVDHQIRIADEQRASRHKLAAIARAAKGPKPPRKMPLSGKSMVIVHAEANAWPRGSEHGPYPEVVHLVAERIATPARLGARFEAFVAPTRPLAPGFEHHTLLSESQVLAGESRSAFQARFLAFLREGDVLGVWGFYAMDLLRREGLELPPLVDVRTTAIRFLGRRAGDATETAALLGCEVGPTWAQGRTGIRHASALGVARALSR